MNLELDDDDAAERQELDWYDRQRRAYQVKLMAHPDPRDPDYPGHPGDEEE